MELILFALLFAAIVAALYIVGRQLIGAFRSRRERSDWGLTFVMLGLGELFLAGCLTLLLTSIIR